MTVPENSVRSTGAIGADEASAIAAGMRDQHAKGSMENIALGYLKLAEHADRRAVDGHAKSGLISGPVQTRRCPKNAGLAAAGYREPQKPGNAGCSHLAAAFSLTSTRPAAQRRLGTVPHAAAPA